MDNNFDKEFWEFVEEHMSPMELDSWRRWYEDYKKEVQKNGEKH